MKEKLAMSTVAGKNQPGLIHRSVCSGMLLLLFISFTASAQQMMLQERLQYGIEKVEQVLQQVRQRQDSLHSLSAALPDTVALQAKLDSLRLQYTDSAMLAQKTDSLLQSFFDQQRVQVQLKEAEGRLELEIGQAKESLTQRLTPKQMQEALGKLKEAENLVIPSMSDLQNMAKLPEMKLPEGVPPAGELQKLASQEGMEEYMKDETLKALEDRLATQQEMRRKLRAELNKYKGRVEKVESVRDMPKGFFKFNPMKDKPWQERVVLGSFWQFSNQEHYSIDLGPSVAYRFTDRLSAGAGLQYRLSVSVKEKPWVQSPDKVLGYLAYSDYEVKKGFFGRLHYEDLNTPVPRLDASGKVEDVGQEWVKGLSVGVGKNYTFYKRIQGYTLVQYNVLHQHGKTPYLRPLQARIGFYINLKDLKLKRNKPKLPEAEPEDKLKKYIGKVVL